MQTNPPMKGHPLNLVTATDRNNCFISVYQQHGGNVNYKAKNSRFNLAKQGTTEESSERNGGAKDYSELHCGDVLHVMSFWASLLVFRNSR